MDKMCIESIRGNGVVIVADLFELTNVKVKIEGDVL